MISNAAKYLDILVWAAYHFLDIKKLFSELYPAKLLTSSAKSFFPCICCLELTIIRISQNVQRVKGFSLCRVTVRLDLIITIVDHLQMTALFERVKETIAERILVKSWLDDETRTQALQKLNSLRGRFHVSPDFYNDTLLTREMAEVRRYHLLLLRR